MTSNLSSADIHDLSDLHELTEETVLDCIRDRFHRDIIYTYIGDVLVAVNPFKQLPIYDQSHHDLYKGETVRKQNLPHVYWVAGNAFRSLVESRKGRCIIVGGISGAGKTESTKHIFEHILHQGGNHHSNLVENLKGINPLLELFGNSVTRLNNNSSRFGKLIGLKYDVHGKLDEVHISCYMLEKSRVIKQHDRERNFHIFYAFTRGISDEKLKTLALSRRALYDSKIIHGHGEEPGDDTALENARQIMLKVGFTEKHIDDMYRILAAILVVANVKFSEDEFNGLTVVHQESESCMIPTVCSLLHIEKEDLILALITSSSHTQSGELITSGKTVQKAKDGRDAFAKYLYNCLFDALVKQINMSLKHMSGSQKSDDQTTNTYELSILDISGFENLTDPGDRNSYEQLLINITNEHMHQFFLKKVLKAELETYEREGVQCEDLPDTSSLDNQSTIELLTKSKLGVLRILEDSTASPKANDEDFVHQLNKFNHTRPEFRLNPRDNCAFKIKHFAGEVEYDAHGFLDKNRDTMTEDLKKCLQKSDNFFLPRTSGIHDSISKRTIQRFRHGINADWDRGKLQGYETKEFQKSLQRLLSKIEKTEPLFVRCIKSNIGQEPGYFDETFVTEQLLRSGVLEISRVRKQGFSVRMTFDEFLKRFGKISETTQHVMPQKERVKGILEEVHIDQYVTGDRLVLMKHDSLDTLAKMRAEIERKQEEAKERERQKQLEHEKLHEVETETVKNSESSTLSTSISTATNPPSGAPSEKMQPGDQKEDKQHDTLAFDSFRQVENHEEETHIIEEYVLPAARLFVFICLFVTILGSGTIMKLLFRTLIDNYSKDRETLKNSVDLLLCIGVPSVLSLLGSLVKVMFGSVKSLKMKYLAVVVPIGVLHMLGVGVLIFNILPHFDAFRGNMILMNVALVPSLMSFLMKLRRSNCVPQRKIVSLFATCVALATQVGGAIYANVFIITKDVIQTDDDGIFKLRLMYPVTVFLISLEWWENFISGRRKIFFVNLRLDTFRRHLEKTRTKTNVIVIIAQLVTIIVFGLFLTKRDIFEIRRVGSFKTIKMENQASSLIYMNSTAITRATTPNPNFNLENFILGTVTNNATNVTEEVRTFISGSKNYTCVTLNETAEKLALSCISDNSTLDLNCNKGSLACSPILFAIGPNTTTPNTILGDHYVLFSESDDTVTFTNTTNNVTCVKKNETEGRIRLFCKNYGVTLQLFCESGYSNCERIFAIKESTLIQRIVDIWQNNYLVFYILVLSIVFTYCSVFACKLHMQRFSFSLSIILISPLTSVMIYLNCTDILSFEGIIPDVASCTPMDIDSIKLSIIQGGGLWIGIVLLTYYIWNPRCEKMAKNERLFVEPLKECFFTDINMLLRRKNDRTHRYKKVATRTLSRPDASRHKEVPQIKVCATMWHETVFEMSQLLKSLFRLDIHHAASVRVESKSNHIDPDSFIPEIHIIFDDAFETTKQNGRWIRKPNKYVMQFLECNEKAARDIAKCNPGELELIPNKIITPFGAQLLFTMPGGTKMLVHLKDKKKIRHRKRWSQILYLYYLLGFKTFGMKKLNDILTMPVNAGTSLLSFLQPEYQEQMRNTFILTLDGDVDFNPDAVILLLDRMKKNPKTGAVCGRIHPIGSGPMVWYQQFEYAVGHWLQKAAEHVLGCVLCCPGCFSLFRASALMDDNVMNTYTTKPTEARHYIQFEQGEDRWLCTLLLQRGHKIDYEAGADALTYAPETFNDFFVQRRRWAPSTMANIMDLLSSWKNTCKRNDNISTFFIVYQFVMLFSSLLAPATVTLMIAGSYATVLNLDATYSFFLSILPVALFVIVCMKCKNDTQLNVAALLCSLYTLIMVIVTVGTILNLVNDDFFSPNVMFLVGLGSIFTFAGLWHPKEITCLFHGLLYYFTVPSTFIFLTVYFICNLNNVSWGTREGPKVAETSESQNNVSAPEKMTFMGKCMWLLRGTFCDELVRSMTKEVQERFNSKTSTTSTVPPPTVGDIRSGEDPKENSIDYGIWMHLAPFDKGEFLTCSEEETQFWEDILKKYLYPLDNDHVHQEQIKLELASLRNNVVFAFFMLNFMFAVALLQLQLNRDKILPFYILNKYEPVSVAFLAVFATLLIVQFIAMILHQLGTFLHLVSNSNVLLICFRKKTDEQMFRGYRNECVDLINGESRILNTYGGIAESSESDKDHTISGDERPVTVKSDDQDSDLDETEKDDEVPGLDMDLGKEPSNFYNQRYQRNYRIAMRTVRRRRKQSRGNIKPREDPRLAFYELQGRGRPQYNEYTGHRRVERYQRY